MKHWLLLGLLIPSLHAQAPSRLFPDAVTAIRIDVPKDNGKAILLPSMVMYQLPVCNLSGACYAEFALNPAKGFESVVGKFSLEGESKTIRPAAIEGLSYVQILSFAPLGDGVALLLHASVADGASLGKRLAPKPSLQPEWSKMAASGIYLGVFDSTGQLSAIHQLDLRFAPAKIARIGSDQLLVIGYDTARRQSVVAVLNDDGKIVRFLDQDGSFPTAKELESGISNMLPDDAPERIKQQAMSGALSTMQSGYAGKNLLILQPGVNAIIWSISPSGEIRKVKLKVPEGISVHSIVSSDRDWLLRSFISKSDTGILLKFNPEDGELTNWIDSPTVPPTSIFFEKDRAFYALWWNKEVPFILESK